MNIKMLELVLIVVVAFGLAFWQLYDINKELKKDRQGDQPRKPDPDSTAPTKVSDGDSGD